MTPGFNSLSGMAIDPNRPDGSRHTPDGNGDGDGTSARVKWMLGLSGLALLCGALIRRRRPGHPSLLPVVAPPLAIATVPASAPPHPARGHETRDANAKWIFAVVGALFVLGISIQLMIGRLAISLKHTPPPTDRWDPIANASHPAPSRPAFPRLQISPPADLLAFHEKEEAELHGYSWVNKTSGIVHIPIERAMDLILQEGLPVRSNANANRVGPSTYELMWRRPEHREQEIQGQK